MKKELYSISYPIFKKTIENQGVSMNLDGLKPVTGYMVGLKGHEVRINISDFNEGHIDSFIRSHLYILHNRKAYIGTWIKNDTVYIDLSINLDNKAVALAYCSYNGQICIWDVLNKVEIYQLQEETV